MLQIIVGVTNVRSGLGRHRFGSPLCHENLLGVFGSIIHTLVANLPYRVIMRIKLKREEQCILL